MNLARSLPIQPAGGAQGTAGAGAPRSSSSSSATNSRFSAANPPPMPDAEELEAARRLATLALAELSRHDKCFSTSPPCAGLPALLRHCLGLLPLLNAGDPRLAARCCCGLLAFLGAIISRNPSPSLLPSLEVLVNCPLCSWLRQFLYERFRNLFELLIAPFHLNVL